MSTFATRSQRMAEQAFRAVSQNVRAADKEYSSFAKSFPALIQSAGLCQAIAFAQAKGKGDEGKPHTKVLADVLATMGQPDICDMNTLAMKSRTANVTEYLRLSRIALQAATWVKRYVESLEAEPTS